MSDSANNTDPRIEVLSRTSSPALEAGQEVATLVVTLPVRSEGTPPHRHGGPVFGHLVQGAMAFEVEGQPERIVRAGESFSEPGGDVIHYRDANAADGEETVFVVTMLLREGDELLTLVDAGELAARAHLRAER